MTWVRLRLTLPQGSWLADVSRAHAESALRAMAVIEDDGVGYALVAVTGPDRDAVVDEVRDHEAVADVEVVGVGEFEITVQVTGEAPRFVTAARRSGLPIEFPIEVVEGTAELEVVGKHDRITRLSQQLEKADVAFDVELVGRYDDVTRVLTDAQRELVLAAIDEGYYDTPRQCTLTELAEKQRIAKSTCSETLQRAQERLMKRIVDQLPGASTGERRDAEVVA